MRFPASYTDAMGTPRYLGDFTAMTPEQAREKAFAQAQAKGVAEIERPEQVLIAEARMYYGETSVVVGEWVEKVARDLTHCPSYYAADTETIRTRPGRYPASVIFTGGYLVPMPYWLVARIDGDRIAGRLYSGFGGHNFASRELPQEPAPWHVQTYVSAIPKLVAEGVLEIKPQFAGLVAEHRAQIEWARQYEPDDLRALGRQQ
jgi:hypothetical protein